MRSTTAAVHTCALWVAREVCAGWSLHLVQVDDGPERNKGARLRGRPQHLNTLCAHPGAVRASTLKIMTENMGSLNISQIQIPKVNEMCP